MIARMLLAAVIGLAFAAGATAQTKKGPNGGVVVLAEHEHIEFVQRGEEIAFHVTEDSGKAMPTKGLQARATVQDGGKTVNVTLSPAEPNMFVGKIAAPLGPKARVVFSSRWHGHAVQARFVVD